MLKLTMQWQGSSPLAQGTHLECTALSGAVQAHPRSRGEHKRRSRLPSSWYGSSPLARGTRGLFDQERAALGLIPARAGKTHSAFGFHTHRQGLIPAHAGNTEGQGCATPFHPAHPRSRGEHSSESIKNYYVCGSSPLARGTLGHRYPTGN